MPFPVISTALGVCFLLVWVLIGGMVFRDCQMAVRRERETGFHVLSGTRRRTGSRKSAA